MIFKRMGKFYIINIWGKKCWLNQFYTEKYRCITIIYSCFEEIFLETVILMVGAFLLTGELHAFRILSDCYIQDV